VKDVMVDNIGMELSVMLVLPLAHHSPQIVSWKEEKRLNYWSIKPTSSATKLTNLKRRFSSFFFSLSLLSLSLYLSICLSLSVTVPLCQSVSLTLSPSIHLSLFLDL
jgi:hypothetical protein